MSTQYILRFDDISPGMAWSKFLPLKSKLEEIGIRSLLGVVPDCRDPSLSYETERSDFFDMIRQWADFGDTIVQHGTYHLYDSENAGLLGINKRSEFSGHEFEKQYERLALGKSVLEKEGVWQPYFMAPAHSFDAITLKALKKLDFQAITDGYGFFPYHIQNMILIPQLTSFPFNVGFGYCTICIHINTVDEAKIEQLLIFAVENKEAFVSFDQVAKVYLQEKKYSHLFLRVLTSLLARSKRAL